jgi:PAS domain S-box-containing protein
MGWVQRKPIVMIPPALPSNDDLRVKALQNLGLLATDREERFDRLTRMSARMFNVPIAYVSLLDRERQCIKSSVGIDFQQTPRSESFCGHTILEREPLVIPDALADARFHDNPLVAGPPHIRFYAGVALTTEDDLAVGTLCLADRRPREFSAEDHDLLKQIATLARDEINYRGRRQLAAIINSSDDAIISKTLDGIVTTWNRGADRIFGFSAEEMIGKPMLVLFPPDRMAEETEILRRIARGENIDHFETERVRKDGRIIQVSVTISPITDEKGKVIGASKIARDITERKQAEARIAEQADFLDEAKDAILVRDLEGKIVYWNKGAERIYGWLASEVMARNIAVLLYKDPRVFKKCNELTLAQGEWSGELHHVTKTGREIVIEARWSLVRDAAGRPKSVLAINTDITDKKKIEAQFMRAQRMESIGTLASGFAHDLNNILAPIMMSIDVLKGFVNEPGATTILETLGVSARRGADIVRQVLSFARGLEGERIEIQPKHLLKDIESIIRDTFPKDIQLRFFTPNDIWTILGDPTQIHQVLLNLCVNARDAMPLGGSLKIEAENAVLDEQYAAMNLQARPGRYVQISVADSGTGIAPELLDKIFEPFFTTKDLNKGTGLGLSTVMAIVKSHEGIVNVYSESGRGTTFKVYLPAFSGETGGSQEFLEENSLPRGNGEKILVVDDEASILTITSQTLEAFGYRVLTAPNGADALAIFAERRAEISVVLTDMRMPVLDGKAMIYALMRLKPSIKIIAASGLDVDGSVAQVLGQGVKQFLIKPYTASMLLKALRAILDEPNGSAARM